MGTGRSTPVISLTPPLNKYVINNDTNSSYSQTRQNCLKTQNCHHFPGYQRDMWF
jgi:hypothetical protein